ncbi:MAG: hypothetical protein KKC05_00350 [Nanoarchaeota archaeon]|nr:hypothetical protein [Nanoarchaeota archaeon]
MKSKYIVLSALVLVVIISGCTIPVSQKVSNYLPTDTELESLDYYIVLINDTYVEPEDDLLEGVSRVITLREDRTEGMEIALILHATEDAAILSQANTYGAALLRVSTPLIRENASMIAVEKEGPLIGDESYYFEITLSQNNETVAKNSQLIFRKGAVTGGILIVKDTTTPEDLADIGRLIVAKIK